jgi:hypothetical protein
VQSIALSIPNSSNTSVTVGPNNLQPITAVVKDTKGVTLNGLSLEFQSPRLSARLRLPSPAPPLSPRSACRAPAIPLPSARLASWATDSPSPPTALLSPRLAPPAR